MKKQLMSAAFVAVGMLASAPNAKAVTCVNGVYRAGCAGPHGAAVVRKSPYHPYYRPHGAVACASGPYRAGCAGPRGAVVRPY